MIFAALLCFLSPRFLVMIAEWFCFFHTENGPLFETSPSLSCADTLGTGPGWARVCCLKFQCLFGVWEPLPTEG